MAIIISKDLIKLASERGALNVSNGFRLTPDFVGDYKVISVQKYKFGRSKTANGFRIEMKKAGDNTKPFFIPDYHLMRSFIVANTPASMKITVQGKPHNGIAYRDDVDSDLAGAETMSLRHSTMDDNGEIDTISLPEDLTIVGAVVSKVEDNDMAHPAIPLRFYKGYNAVLRYHRSELSDPEAFLTRDDFVGYLEANSKGKLTIPGLPQTIDKLELVNPRLVNQMAVWNHTLLIADTKTDDTIQAGEEATGN